MIRWLLNFDEQSHAHHVNRDDVPQNDQNPLSFNHHRPNTDSFLIQQHVDKKSSSESTGTLYLYNQSEFYHDSPMVYKILFM